MLLRLVAIASLLIISTGCISRNAINMSSKQESIPGISYTGGNGDTFHDAVIINGARDKSAGVAAEYRYISNKHGERGSGWYLVGQTVIREKNKIVDVIEIQLGEDSSNRRIFYFDVGDFLGKRR